MTEPVNYVPHFIIASFTALIAWIGRDHMHRDDTRFRYMADTLRGVTDKLDKAIEKQADNHTEILKLLIQPIRDRRIDEQPGT